MRQKPSERKAIIAQFINDYFDENDQFPAERDIVNGTGIPAGSVHRILVDMRECGEISYDGQRSVRTERLEHISPRNVVPVLGYVACGAGQEEEEQFIEYIHMSERLVGKGTFFALIAKGESMVGEGVQPGDHVIVRRQQTASNGDLVIALLDGKNNLKKLVLENGQCILRSHNDERPGDYPDIIVGDDEELQIQGVAVGVYHGLENSAW